MRKAVLSVAALALFAGCSRSGGSSTDDFVEACLSSTNWDRSACACMARRAETELSDEARDFVVASLGSDEAKTARLRSELGITEAMEAGMFMTEGGGCLDDASN